MNKCTLRTVTHVWKLLHPMIVVSPDGVQRHHDEKRVSPLDDPESNLRELKSTRKSIGEHLGARRVRIFVTKVGTLQTAENEFFFLRYRKRCGLSRQRNDFWTLVQMTHVMITCQNDTKTLTTLCRWHSNPLLDLV